MKEITIRYDEEFDLYELDYRNDTFFNASLQGIISDYLQAALGDSKIIDIFPLKIIVIPPRDQILWVCQRCQWTGLKRELGPEKMLGEFSSWPTCPKCGSIKIGENHWSLHGEEYPVKEMEEFCQHMLDKGIRSFTVEDV